MKKYFFIRKCVAVCIILFFIDTTLISSSGQQIEKVSLPTTRGNTLYVGGSGPGNYTKIQDALDNASTGDTVFVYDESSPYTEHLWINSSVQLIGENAETTVINGHYDPYTVRFSVDNVTVRGFTILGRLTFGSSSCRIDGNRFRFPEGYEGEAIDLYGGFYNVISHNVIWNTNMGIGLVSSWDRIENNTISDNVVVSSEIGIYIRGIGNEGSYLDVKNNTIINNTLVNNDLGIDINDYTINNSAFSNNVVASVVSAVDYGYPHNNWKGNYWSDYTGTDTDDDGYGETPYTIPDYGHDYYPSMKPVHSQLPVPVVYVNPAWEENATWHIWGSIQRGVDDAKAWSAVVVFPGAFIEHVLVNKSLTLVGMKKETTVIDGNGTGSTVVVEASHVTICGFTIQHSGINGDKAGLKIQHTTNPTDAVYVMQTIIKGNWHGISVDSSWNDTFRDNLITNNLEQGICSQNELGNTIIANNTIAQNSFGIFLYGSQSNLINDNTIEQQHVSGIYLWGSQSTIITSNHLEKNENGITVGDSSNTKVTRNTFVDNTVHASFSYKVRYYLSNLGHLTRWWRNYWSGNTGIMKIDGELYYMFETEYVPIPWCQFDIFPSTKPYKTF